MNIVTNHNFPLEGITLEGKEYSGVYKDSTGTTYTVLGTGYSDYEDPDILKYELNWGNEKVKRLFGFEFVKYAEVPEGFRFTPDLVVANEEANDSLADLYVALMPNDFVKPQYILATKVNW